MTAKEKLISIIIPTYNRSEYLTECLNSVLNQNYKHWECLVIDDGSTDDTEQVVKRFVNSDSRIKYFKRTRNYKPGGCGARNYGLDLSTGDYINWFDSDDVMLPEFLEYKIEILEPQLNMMIASHTVVDEQLNFIKTVDLKVQKTIFKDYLLWKENFPVITHDILFKKDFLLKNSFRFNENILRGQETELFRRIFLITKQEDYKINNKPGFLYRQHAGSKTGEDKAHNKKFIKDKIELCLQGLGYVKNHREIKLTEFFLWQATEYLEQTKFISKDLYFYILNTLGSYSDKNFKFKMLLNVIRLNYYIRFPAIIEGKLYAEMVSSFKYHDKSQLMTRF